MLRLCLAVVLLLPCVGCATHGPSQEQVFESTGVFVRHLRVRVSPPDVEAFETIMARCTREAVAVNPGVSHSWLCYREPPSSYWILLMSNTLEGFATSATLEDFVLYIGRLGGDRTADELVASLFAIDYEASWGVTCRQKQEWSTVNNMRTSTHPMARIVEYTIRKGAERSFDDALSARTKFLTDRGYPLPIEGFHLLSVSPNRVWQVVFPTDWVSFHQSDSVQAFVDGLESGAREEFQNIENALKKTVSRIDYFDAEHAHELRYDAG